MKRRYADPAHPYEIALQFCLERLHRFLGERGQDDSLTHCVFEKRGASEDASLELEFRRICDGANYSGTKMNCLDIQSMDKRANSTGLQIADLIARPIGLSVVRPGQPNRAFELLEPKIRRSPSGQVQGWGLKVFP